jgi:hypothetical protein
MIHIRRDFAPWFRVAASFNELGMHVLPAVKVTEINQHLVAATLYGRTLKSFQATYVLAERGMLADARTVVRAGAETAIVLYAVVKDASVCDLLIERYFWHHRKLRKAWLDDPQAVAEMTAGEIDTIKAIIADIDKNHPKASQGKGDPVSIASLAKQAGVMALYNAIYRATSGDAAHTSIDALNRHVRSDGQNNILGLQFGPEVSDLPPTLSDAISVLAHALHAALELFPMQQLDADLAQCEASWKALGVPTEYKPEPSRREISGSCSGSYTAVSSGDCAQNLIQEGSCGRCDIATQ